MIDFSQVNDFARRLHTASPDEAEWKRDTGRSLADRISTSAPQRTGALARSVRPTDEGVEMVDYYRFVEYGTTHMAPQPFIRPAIRRETPEAVDRLKDQTLRDLL